MIEATIVEVTLADGYRQGIDWTRTRRAGWSDVRRAAAATPHPASPR